MAVKRRVQTSNQQIKIPRMRVVFTLGTAILLFCACSTSKQAFFDLEMRKIKLDPEKQNIVVLLSQVSCHQCYLETEKIFIEKGFYSDDDTVITILCVDSKNNLSIASYRKMLERTAKSYFPNAAQILFADLDEEQPKILNHAIDPRILPVVFQISGKKIRFIEYGSLRSTL